MKIAFRCDPALIDRLPRPVPARQALPEWLRRMPPRADSAVHGRSIRTVKQCPPFVDAMGHGFMILLPCDVQVDAGRFEWDWPLPPLVLHDHPRSPLSFHVPEQIAGSPLASPASPAAGGPPVAIKFNSFWTIELEPGWSLMATHPANRLDLPFRLLTGLVDADRFHAVGINFPALWTDPGFSGLLPRGTPLAQCHPVRREVLALECAPMGEVELQRYRELAGQLLAGPGVYRKRFRRKGAA
ncbi:MAG: hypothetical protein KGJ24_16100 [Burkholderiales bacterium]|nr:hypothetical protein [Burkholderiales bacterium]MDE2565717.1 hypothetical protein [Burkholderiales bacterium]